MEHHLLEDEEIRKVFQRIARERLVSFRDLGNILDREGVPVRNGLRGLLEQLVEAGLVEEQKAPIVDFNTYHLTVGGLAADRTRRNLERRRSKDQTHRPKA